jgi:hypothetical protein
VPRLGHGTTMSLDQRPFFGRRVDRGLRDHLADPQLGDRRKIRPRPFVPV